MVRSLEANSLEMQGTTRLVNSASSSFAPIYTDSGTKSKRRLSSAMAAVVNDRSVRQLAHLCRLVTLCPAWPHLCSLCCQLDERALQCRSMPNRWQCRRVSHPCYEGVCLLEEAAACHVRVCLLQRPWLSGKVRAA